MDRVLYVLCLNRWSVDADENTGVVLRMETNDVQRLIFHHVIGFGLGEQFAVDGLTLAFCMIAVT